MEQVVGYVGEWKDEKERHAGWENKTKCTQRDLKKMELGGKLKKRTEKSRKQKDTR